jgi:hypothetical protein
MIRDWLATVTVTNRRYPEPPLQVRVRAARFGVAVNRAVDQVLVERRKKGIRVFVTAVSVHVVKLPTPLAVARAGN